MKLVIGPDPIFKKKALPVEKVDGPIRVLVHQMYDLLYEAQGIGLGANMVGLLQRIVVIDHKPNGHPFPVTYINPQLRDLSNETQTFNEASLSFPGISAEITRAYAVTVDYLDVNGNAQSERLEGWPATVLQHEVDYLDGITFLDHMSTTKRAMLMKKYKNMRKNFK